MLFPKKPEIKNIEDAKDQILNIILNQQNQIKSNLKTSVSVVQNLVSQITEFNNSWTKVPNIYRIAWISSVDDNTTKNMKFEDNIELPNLNHDLELIMKMLNHMREQKKLKISDMPLFLHPDEISIAQKQGKLPHGNISIISQIVIVFQKARVKYVGIVIDRNYLILQNRLISIF
ncbi:MAG TPA: hypothetical protein VH797_09380 [Nitrososphaeraceae archaeon]